MVKKFIIGADNVVKKLSWLQKQSKRHNNVGVIVGYTASYALYVHEMIPLQPMYGRPRGGSKLRDKLGRFKKRKSGGKKGFFWDPKGRGQPKFLEKPFREMQDELTAIIFQTTKSLKVSDSGGLDKGLMLAGLALQRASQLLVPVDLGNLKSSAFTRLVERNRGKG
jgi:hypothetical protein